MLAVAQASLSFSAPLPTFHAVSRTSAPLMQEKSKAIPFLKKPPALDGEAAPGHLSKPTHTSVQLHTLRCLAVTRRRLDGR